MSASVNDVPLVVMLLAPPKAPALLYCTCVVEPPGVPPPPAPHAEPVVVRFSEASTCTHWPVANVVVLTVANLVVVPLTDPTLGATPAPPPITGRLAVSTADEDSAAAELK